MKCSCAEWHVYEHGAGRHSTGSWKWTRRHKWH